MTTDPPTVRIVGAGLAGSEAAYQLARCGVPVVLHEMRPATMTDAHKTGGFAELVCSNSFRSDDATANAVGVLHAEMRRAGSLIMATADRHKIPAGGALAVDRFGFSEAITARIAAEPLISVVEGEVTELPAADCLCIIATGPLTGSSLAEAIRSLTGEDQLAFFDAIAPILYKETVDLSKAWFQSRYDKAGPGGSGADYINCPLDNPTYEHFVDALLAADTAEFKDWEAATPYFEGCLPVEVMAARGRETLRHGPMKPVGLTNPHAPDRKPYAVLQLRQDNALGTLYNVVGFQTKMKHGAQKEVLRLVPGLENAEFARLGGLHRNTFLNSPKLLDRELRLKAAPHIRFAGQITGCEGYVESAAIGLMVARFAAAEAFGRPMTPPPPSTAHGALLAHITGGHLADDDGGREAFHPQSFQPMNVNFGLFPPIDAPTGVRGKARTASRRQALASRALADFDAWMAAEERVSAAA